MPRPCLCLLAVQLNTPPCLEGGVPVWQQLPTAFWAAIQSQILALITWAAAEGPFPPSTGEIELFRVRFWPDQFASGNTVAPANNSSQDHGGIPHPQ